MSSRIQNQFGLEEYVCQGRHIEIEALDRIQEGKRAVAYNKFK